MPAAQEEWLCIERYLVHRAKFVMADHTWNKEREIYENKNHNNYGRHDYRYCFCCNIRTDIVV